uniref:glutathione transferase n=1 Tax=Saccoglossus kowalevskii TaxID=10224 RepID=A0ABM0N0X3_SACKO|nr:PREDICTED: glutathione S-transferase Mu 5-like [Saccoglossus kowalevskii]
MAEQSMDLRNYMVRHFYNPKWEEMKYNFLKTIDEMLAAFSKFLGDNDWYAGKNITFVDFVMYELVDQLLYVDPKVLDKYNNLKAFQSRFETLPKIDAYMKSDRFMKNPLNNPTAFFGMN